MNQRTVGFFYLSKLLLSLIQVKDGLKELKNSYALSFMLVNSMWIAAIFMLQNNQVCFLAFTRCRSMYHHLQDALNVRWRFGPTFNNITFESTLTPGQV